MKPMLDVGDKVYFRESFGKFSRYRILTVVSVKDKIVEMDNGTTFVRNGFKPSKTFVEYFIKYDLTRKSSEWWYLCDDKKLSEIKEANEKFDNNRELIKANILIDSIACGIMIPTDEEKNSIYDAIVKSKNNDEYYNNILL